MTGLPGHDIGPVMWESADFVAYEGVSRASGDRLLIKATKAPPGPELGDPIHGELRLLGSLSGHGFLPCREVLSHEGRSWGVFPWFAGRPLGEVMPGGQLSQDDYLTVLGATALLLDPLHAQHHVHGRLSPQSILWCAQTRRVQLTDLGLTPGAAAPGGSSDAPLSLAALTYASPERMLLAPDSMGYRTDLYSLGVILYEFLFGRPPFAYEDERALVRAHRTEPPPPPTPDGPDVPEQLWSIARQCLEKSPASRYASGAGLEFDLSRCRRQLRDTGHCERFELRSQDVPTQLMLSDRLYGRALELGQLEREYARARDGAKCVVLTSGDPGVGKTSLVNQLRHLVESDGGTFVSGKHQQYQVDQPYVAVSEALHALISPMLASSTRDLEAWREEINQALGENAAVIGSVLPELGFPPPVPLPPRESRNRFLSTFVSFLAHFIRNASPLVLFLDDLQWMDRASEELLSELLASPGIDHLVVIGAYRDKEVHDDSGLAHLLAGDAASQIVHVPLAPLPDDAIEEYLSDSLHAPRQRVRNLARQVREKTNSNPFFMARFIEGLYADGHIRYEPRSRAWTWDDEQLTDVDITDNVVELMVDKLRAYPGEVVETLAHMACLGGSVDVTRLAVLLGTEETEVYRRIQLPAADGVLVHDLIEHSHVQRRKALLAEIATGDGTQARLEADTPEPPSADHGQPTWYRFSHDKVEEAAYGLLDPAARERLHLSIGQCLLAHGDIQGDDIFLVTGQFDRWLDRNTLADGDAAVAALYLSAGQRAKANNAFAAARQCFHNAGSLLDDSSWDTHYALMIALFRDWAETEYLLGNLDRSRVLINKALQFCDNSDDEARLIVLLIDQHTANAEYQQALILGRNALTDLGFERVMGRPFPRRHVEAVLHEEMDVAERYEAQAFAEILMRVGEPEDASLRAMMMVLMSMIPPSYFVDRKLNALVATFMARLTYEKAFICESTAKGISNFGNALAEERGMYQEGYHFARLALRFARERYESMVPRILYSLAGSMNHWVQHLARSEDDIEAGITLCEKYGERDYNGYLRTLARCQNGIFLGSSLPRFKLAVESSLAFVERARNALGLQVAQIVHRAICELDGSGPLPGARDGAGTAAASQEGPESDADTGLVKCFAAVLRAQSAFFLHLPELARDSIAEARAAADNLSTEMTLPMLNLFSSLITLRALRTENAAPAQREDAIDIVHENQKQMAAWAEGCAENFRHAHLLVEGGLAEVAGCPLDAIKAYKSAADSAAEHGFRQFEGLAHEQLARLWEATGQREYARGHRHGAVAAYRAWGATRVLDRLRDAHPESITEPRVDDPPSLHLAPHPADSADAQLYHEVFEATVRTLATSSQLPSLRDTPARQLTELTGAQRALIFIPSQGELSVGGRYPPDDSQNEEIDGDILSLVNKASRTTEVESPDTAPESPAILAVPVMAGSGVVAVAYLENCLRPLNVGDERLGLLRVLSLLTVLDAHAALYAEASHKLGKLERYLPTHVRDAILAREDEHQSAMHREEMGIAFFDLRRFTAFHSSVEPEEGRRLLTQYRHAMGEVIHEYHATIDHWEGDGCMVFIADPVESEQRIRQLVDMTVALRARAKTLIEAWSAEGYHLGFGIGAAYGFADCGIMGTAGRWDYSATGRYVSLASRLCDEAEDGQILVTDRVHSGISGERRTEFAGERRIRGFANSVRVSNIVG